MKALNSSSRNFISQSGSRDVHHSLNHGSYCTPHRTYSGGPRMHTCDVVRTTAIGTSCRSWSNSSAILAPSAHLGELHAQMGVLGALGRHSPAVPRHPLAAAPSCQRCIDAPRRAASRSPSRNTPTDARSFASMIIATCHVKEWW